MTAEAILAAVSRARQASQSFTITETESLADYGLNNIHCERCNDKGYLIRQENGITYSRPCPCMKQRVSIRNVERSGIKDMLDRYCFSTYEDVNDTCRKIHEKAVLCASMSDRWFYIAGRAGSGKTHICTALCKVLMGQGNAVKYMLWRDETTALKALVNEQEEYERRIEKLKKIQVLYIDDFFKGSATDADIRLAFEILNFRYNDRNLKTIISSEHTLEEIISLDEALGSRIYERSRGFVLKSPERNFRLEGI